MTGEEIDNAEYKVTLREELFGKKIDTKKKMDTDKTTTYKELTNKKDNK